MELSFSDAVVQKVWEKAKPQPGYGPERWRKDECGAWIARDQYGNHGSIYGWDVDHISPVSRGGGDEPSNLRPLQWEKQCGTAGGPTELRRDR